jgi:hypothetical protein
MKLPPREKLVFVVLLAMLVTAGITYLKMDFDRYLANRITLKEHVTHPWKIDRLDASKEAVIVNLSGDTVAYKIYGRWVVIDCEESITALWKLKTSK